MAGFSGRDSSTNFYVLAVSLLRLLSLISFTLTILDSGWTNYASISPWSDLGALCLFGIAWAGIYVTVYQYILDVCKYRLTSLILHHANRNYRRYLCRIRSCHHHILPLLCIRCSELVLSPDVQQPGRSLDHDTARMYGGVLSPRTVPVLPLRPRDQKEEQVCRDVLATLKRTKENRSRTKLVTRIVHVNRQLNIATFHSLLPTATTLGRAGDPRDRCSSLACSLSLQSAITLKKPTTNDHHS